MKFTQDEINLICIYDTSDKAELEKQLRLSVPYIENAELKGITETVIYKLEHMTAAEIEQTEFMPTVTKADMED
jgi:hypothetical protein